MKVEIVCLKQMNASNGKLLLVANIINHSKADVILFPGHTIKGIEQLNALLKLINNRTCYIFLEVYDKKIIESYRYYLLNNGNIIHHTSRQFITNYRDVKPKNSMIGLLIDELEKLRIFTVKGKKILLLQCGEINLIRTNLKDGTSFFALSEQMDFNNRFQTLLSSVDIVLNPTHSAFGRLGNVNLKRKFLSENQRYYFSTCNTDKVISANLLSLQSVFYNGNPIDVDSLAEIRVESKYISRTIELD